MIKTYIETRYFDPYAVPFYVEDASGQGGTLTMDTAYSDATNIEYSTDKKNWTVATASGTTYSIPVAANSKTYIRANATTLKCETYNSGFINCSSNFNIGGNIMSLFYGSNFTGNETTFPDSTQTSVCMSFINSYNLESAGNLLLPATTIPKSGYYKMFQNCSRLNSVPSILPATTLGNNCYELMFNGCTLLTDAPALPATTLANNCYASMFRSCTHLTTAPTLPATTLVYGCYNYMFNGCTSLNSVTVGATSWNTGYATNWLNNVSATGTFTKPSGTTIPEGTNGIPSGWTVVNV